MILVKFPTRSRPKRFIEYLSLYITTQETEDVYYLITLDYDDETVTDDFIDEIISVCEKCIIVKGYSEGKIHACNRDIEDAGVDWDIIILASDDMKPVTNGWDRIISDGFSDYFPDFDGVLYFSDGYTSLNTMCIMGRKYFDRFNYIYHPDYTSLWADNEFQDVSQRLGKEKRFEQVLFKHEHPANTGGVGHDLLYNQNERYYTQDHKVYLRRRAQNFYL